MELILFTNSFPYGSGEQFLECEILFLSKSFSRITIIPLTDDGIHQARKMPDNVSSVPAMLPVSLKQRIRLFFLAVFNLQPVRMFLADFLKYRVCLKKSWLMNWLSASSIARAAMRSASYKMMNEIVTPTTLFYFYWADKSTALCTFLKKEFPCNKFIVRFHGTDLYETKSPGYMPFREILLRNTDLAVFISSNGKEFLHERYPFIHFHSIVSRLGVLDHGEGIPSADNILRIVSCSNMVRIKRLDLLIEALKLIKFEVEWTHIGDGELMNELKKRSEELPSNIRSRFLGSLANSDVIQYYRKNRVDLFVNVSQSEGLPVSIMEAISFGIPVIAPAIGGIPEIVNGKNGFLISLINGPVEIAETIIRFINLPDNEKLNMRIEAKHHWSIYFNANTNYVGFCERIKSVMND